MKQRMARLAVAALLAGGVAAALASPAPAGLDGAAAPITVTKVVTGTEPPGASYVISVSCIGTGTFVGDNPSADLTFPAGGGSQQFNGVPGGYLGDCTFTENFAGGATHITYACSVQQVLDATCGGGGSSPSTLNVDGPAGEEPLATITVTNDFTPAPVVAQPTSTG